MTRALCLAAITLSLTSCLRNGDSTCRTTTVAPALAVTGPKTVAVNQPAVYTIDYQLVGACGSLLNVGEQTSGNARFVGVNVQYDGCDCPATTLQKQTTYTVQPTQAGTYYLQFISDNGYISDTLVVK